jgi:lipid-binding SYLF domain-containing protein
MKRGWLALQALAVTLMVFAVATSATAATGTSKPQEVVNGALTTLNHFMADPDFPWFRSHVKDAKAVLIVPRLYKAAFFVGGAGGNAVLLVRDDKTGEWSQPAFYTIGSASFGLQFGGEASEVILMVMTPKGIESLYTSSFKLGADASVAAGPVGAGVEGATAPNLSADYLSFSRSKGAFIGISLEGAVIAARDEYNKTYYGKPVRPVDILVKGDVANPRSAKLRQAVAEAAKQ